MDIALENPQVFSNIKIEKNKVVNELKERLEKTKLELIYSELEEKNIPFERKYTTAKELKKDLKEKLGTADFNNLENIINHIETSLENTVSELENGSTNAFTKLVTSDLTKNIATSLGITLTGRTLLLLAPTALGKAAVGVGLAGYSLYRVIKNRKDIINNNENNELNTILSELETTKENDKVIDTRFDKKTQELIREKLKSFGITFEDTGYRSLREAIYNLNFQNKKGLIDYLNTTLGKGIEVEERIKKARKKLNVVASAAATASAGAYLGKDIADTINAIDSGLGASTIINGTLLGELAKKFSSKKWFSILSGALGSVGTILGKYIPVIGPGLEKAFAIENVAAFTTLGAAAGVVTSVGLGIASGIKGIINYTKNKKENEEFLKIDSEKYQNEDEKEFILIRENLSKPKNEIEVTILDIILGYLRDENISLENIPNSLHDLKIEVNKLDADEKKKACKIINNIEDEINDKGFIDSLKKAGKISACLLTTGVAALSVYDIIKGGNFLPELSIKIFGEKGNIYVPLPVPDGINIPLDTVEEASEIASAKGVVEKLTSDDFIKELSPDDIILNAAQDVVASNENIKWWKNPVRWFLSGFQKQNELDAAITVSAGNRLLGTEAGKGLIHEAIHDELKNMNDKNLLYLMRYLNNADNSQITIDNPEILPELKAILFDGSNGYITRVENYIKNINNINEMNNAINTATKVVTTAAVPAGVVVATGKTIQTNSTNDEFEISDDEINRGMKK